MTALPGSGQDGPVSEVAVVWVDDLETEVCWTLVANAPIGRLAFVDDGAPRIFPVNHRVDGHSVVFRTEGDSPFAPLLDGRLLAFEVDGADPAAETGWSVLVTGRLERVTGDLDRLAALDVHPWAPGGNDTFVRLVPASVSGRAISRRRRPGGGDLEPYSPTA